MKKLILSAVCMFAAVAASAAGPIEFGVKAGVNSGDFSLDKNNLESNYLTFNKARTGFLAGAWMRVGLGGLFIQPEFLYNWNAYDASVWSGPTDAGSTSKIKVQTLDVPALLGYKLLILRLNAGPVFTIMNKTHTKGGVINSASVMKPSVSYTAGLGLDIAKLNFDVRYNGMFSKTKQTIDIGNQSFRSKTNANGWSVSVGYAF